MGNKKLSKTSKKKTHQKQNHKPTRAFWKNTTRLENLSSHLLFSQAIPIAPQTDPRQSILLVPYGYFNLSFLIFTSRMRFSKR